MNYDEAFYHQLMLEAGITDKYTATLDHLLEIEDPLSDIVLELSSSGSDINKAISCLRNYTLDKTIDYNAVFDMVLEHLRRKYFDRELTIEELTDAMSIIAVNSGKWQDEPWYTMYLIDDLYNQAESDSIDKGTFESSIHSFLCDKTIITQPFKQKRTHMRDLIRLEKKNMNSIRYFVNYRIVPLYVLLAAGMLVAFGILMGIDEERFLTIGLCLLGAITLLTVSVLISVPFVRNKEIYIEMSRYDFDLSDEAYQDVYDFSSEELCLRFDKNAMYLDGKCYWYNHLTINVVASNFLQRILLAICFKTDADNE